MSIYLDHKLDTSADGATHHELLQWHKRQSLLAVSSYNEGIGSEINFFHDNGQRTEDDAVRKAGFRVVCMSWHPEKRVLAVGWSNGDVALRSLEEASETMALPESPTSAISSLEWSSNGLRLLVTDLAGEALLHKIDHRGHPHSSPYSQNRLKEPIKCAVLKPPHSMNVFGISDSPESDDALDMFSRRRLNDSSNNFITHSESSTFFLGGTQGGVFCLRENGTVQDTFRAEQPVHRLFYFAERDRLLTLTEGMILFQHSINPDCQAEEQLRVKLSGKLPHFDIIWVNPAILAMSSGENQVRLWDLQTEENCVLTLNTGKGYSANDAVQSMAFCLSRNILSAALSTGQIAMWKRTRSSVETDLQEQWVLQSPAQVSGLIVGLQWAIGRAVLAVCTPRDVYMLREQTMLAHFNDKYAAVQTGHNAIAVTRIEKFVTADLRPELKQLLGVYVTDRCVAAWDGHKVLIYELGNSGDAVVVGNFHCGAPVVALREQNVYTLEPARLHVRTYQGTVKQILALSEIEGDPTILDISGHYLALGTSTGFVKIFDLSRREARQQFHPKWIAESLNGFGSLESIRINSTGTRVSCIVRKIDRTIDSKLYVWDAESDALLYFNFENGLSDQQEYDAAGATNFKDDTRYILGLAGRVPSAQFWDKHDPRLLVTEAVVPEHMPLQMVESFIVGFFVTTDQGVLVHDSFAKSPVSENLIGVEVPSVFFTKKPDVDFPVDKHQQPLEKLVTRYLVRRVFREFVGLESADVATREAMLNFSFYLTVGNMDEAFKAIKLIKSESVWENMAQMCVKTQRLDVAAVCLGNMGHARGARALRRAQRTEKETEVKVATLAIHLGLVDDAATLYRSCSRFDLLNKLLQTTNQWKLAFEIAQKQDRIHLRNTYYNYAGHLESIGAIEGAIDNYEKSDTHRFEIPRMLFDDPMILEQYVKKKKDSYLQKWWAQYLESLGEMEAARSYYRSASDYLSVVRICCYLGDIDQAAAVANESSDKAACYHLARQYENNGQISAAVHFFSKAHAYSSAIRLAKEHGLEDKIAQLSLMSSESDMIEAAKFYENKPGQADKAVMLYHKAGLFGRALDLAFRTEQFSALDLIASDLDENSDPRVLERCAEFFAQNQQYTKAVQLLAYAKQFKEAVDLCLQKNVPISEQLAELLTPTKEAVPNATERLNLLQQIADCCMHQGHYHYAAKKYTQAGSKTEAMRALLKSGDTEKIVFFANTARSKDIYVMAANYLQTVDWKENPDIMKQIVAFYTKGGAPERLGAFYDSCAQVEIDDYRDYEKASSALQEALRCLTRSDGKEVMQTQELADQINRKITLIKKFLNIRTIYEADPVDAMQQLQLLANENDVNDAVRLGDIYAVLIIHNVKKNNFKKAYSYVDELRTRMPRLDLGRYVKPQILDTIYRELNLRQAEEEVAEDEDQYNLVPESVTLKRAMDQNDNSIMNGDDLF